MFLLPRATRSIIDFSLTESGSYAQQRKREFNVPTLTSRAPSSLLQSTEKTTREEESRQEKEKLRYKGLDVPSSFEILGCCRVSQTSGSVIPEGAETLSPGSCSMRSSNTRRRPHIVRDIEDTYPGYKPRCLVLFHGQEEGKEKENQSVRPFCPALYSCGCVIACDDGRSIYCLDSKVYNAIEVDFSDMILSLSGYR